MSKAGGPITIAGIVPWRLAMRAGNILGIIYGFLAFAKRKRMAAELTKLFPDCSTREIRNVINNFFRAYILAKMDAFFYPSLNSQNIGQITDVRGTEHLEEALRKQKGAVLVHAHFGNPQMLMPALGHRGFRIRQVGLSPDDVYRGVREITGGRPDFLAFIWLKIKERVEKSLPVDFIHIGKVSLKNIYEALEKNEIIAMTVDGVDGDKFAWNFLGRKTTHFVPGAARVALKSGAALIPLFVVRNTDNTQTIFIEPAIHVGDEGSRGQEALTITSRFLELLEKYVREYPWLYARYFGFHNVPFFEKDI